MFQLLGGLSSWITFFILLYSTSLKPFEKKSIYSLALFFSILTLILALINGKSAFYLFLWGATSFHLGLLLKKFEE